MSDQDEIILRLNAAIRKTIDHQIETDDPPEVGITFERLRRSGFTEEQTYEMMGRLVVGEFKNLFGDEKGFSLESYVQALKQLPELPSK